MNKMTRVESIIVGFALGLFCPLLLFVLCWWITATLIIYHVLRIAESVIAVVAFTGLALGVMLDVFFLRRWIPRFYSIDVRVMILVQLDENSSLEYNGGFVPMDFATAIKT